MQCLKCHALFSNVEQCERHTEDCFPDTAIQWSVLQDLEDIRSLITALEAKLKLVSLEVKAMVEVVEEKKN